MPESLTPEQVKRNLEELEAKIGELNAKIGNIAIDARMTPTQIDSVADKSVKCIAERFYLIPQKMAGWAIGATVVIIAATGWLGYKSALKGASDKLAEVGVTAGVKRIKEGAAEADKLLSGFAGVPVGTIVAWHKHPARHQNNDGPPGEPILGEPPAGWLECNGQVFDDKDSELYKRGMRKLPDLNAGTAQNDEPIAGRFLRGGKVSGVKQDATRVFLNPNFSIHAYPQHNVKGTNLDDDPVEVRPTINGKVGVDNAGGVIGFEGIKWAPVRPSNMSVVWIIRVR